MTRGVWQMPDDRLPPCAAGNRVERTRVSIASGPLMAPVMARLMGVHAARADLPVDRFSDALLIADALSAQAASIAEHGCLQLSIQAEGGRLEIRVGPLHVGGAQRLLDGARMPQTGAVVEQLADEVHIRSGAAGGEMLVLRLGR